MTLDQLRYFAAAASYQHIGRAANVVAISPSVISLAITNLEAELGCDLFLRKGRNIELTTEGEKLLKKASAILESVQSLKQEMKSDRDVLRGHFRLGASHFLASKHLVQEWQRVHKIHPLLTADLHSLDTAQVIGGVLAGRLDFGLAISPQIHPELIQKTIYEGKLVAVVRKRHPILKESSKKQLTFLKESSAILHKSHPGVDVCESNPVFERLGFRPKIDLTFDSDEIAVAQISHSDYWSFLPDMVVDHFSDKLEIIHLPKAAGEANYHISAIVHGSQVNSPFMKG